LEVVGLTSDHIGSVAAGHGLTLLELSPQRISLEEAFMELTRDAVEYRANSTDEPLELRSTS
jgi:ABC-2 type transport system ATP-binding protein